MARNHLTSTHYPYLPVRIGVGEVQGEVMSLVDTGFSAEVIVPDGFLGPDAEVQGYANLEVADRRTIRAPVYLGVLDIMPVSAGMEVAVIQMGSMHVLGRGVIDLFKVTFDHGQRIVVER